jgi:hypothetical protein
MAFEKRCARQAGNLKTLFGRERSAHRRKRDLDAAALEASGKLKRVRPDAAQRISRHQNALRHD